MKTIGLLGGMSWESSQEYYRIINEMVKTRLGGLHSADCLMYSFDFAEIEALQMAGDWDEATRRMIAGTQRLVSGGADLIIICTNTMHKLFDDIQQAIDCPLIHIADPTANAIKAQGMSRIGLLGTMFTMEGDFYRGRLESEHGLEVLIPDDPGRDSVHRIIYDELVMGEIKAESRARYIEVIQQLAGVGVQGIILGCTEIGLLIQPEHSPVPVFDTTHLHAVAAVDAALG